MCKYFFDKQFKKKFLKSEIIEAMQFYDYLISMFLSKCYLSETSKYNFFWCFFSCDNIITTEFPSSTNVVLIRIGDLHPYVGTEPQVLFRFRGNLVERNIWLVS